ncbi:MAG TPA: hypothetical protein VII41_09270, partial [Steroidobacteraceae bacterium]
MNLLKIQAQHENKTVESRIRQQAHHRGQREHPALKQFQRQHRLKCAAFIDEEPGGKDGEGSKTDEHPTIA